LRVCVCVFVCVDVCVCVCLCMYTHSWWGARSSPVQWPPLFHTHTHTSHVTHKLHTHILPLQSPPSINKSEYTYDWVKPHLRVIHFLSRLWCDALIPSVRVSSVDRQCEHEGRGLKCNGIEATCTQVQRSALAWVTNHCMLYLSLEIASLV